MTNRTLATALEETGIDMESEESNLPIERVEGPGEERIGIGNVTNPGGKELSFEKLSSTFGQAMQQLVKETDMETAAVPRRR